MRSRQTTYRKARGFCLALETGIYLLQARGLSSKFNKGLFNRPCKLKCFLTYGRDPQCCSFFSLSLLRRLIPSFRCFCLDSVRPRTASATLNRVWSIHGLVSLWLFLLERSQTHQILSIAILNMEKISIFTPA